MSNDVVARDLMTRPVRRLTSRTPVRDASDFLRRHGISGAPVEDEHGRWIGVFSFHDVALSLTRATAEPVPERSLEAREPVAAAGNELEVRHMMTPGMVTVFPDSSLAEVIRTMVSAGVHRVFVIHERLGTLEGVITPMDVMRHLDDARQRAAAARA